MRHGRSVIGGLTLALTTALGGGTGVAVAAEAPAPGWGPVVDLTQPARSTYAPDLALDPDGKALAVWIRGEKARSRVMAAWQRASGTWTVPRRVPGTGGAVEAEIAFEGDGDLVLAWAAGRRVKAVRRSAGGSWGEPATLHRTPAGVRGTRPASLDLAVNARGRAVLSWETLDDDLDSTYARSRVQAVVGGAKGRWSRARTLSSAGRDAFGAEVAVSRAGRVAVVWDETAGSRGQIMTASLAAGRGWDRSRPLSRRLGHPSDPQLAALPSGELAVAWNRGGTNAGITMRRWSHGGGWSRAVAVPGVKADAWWLDLGIDGEGAVTLAWSNQAGAVFSARQTSAGAWTRSRVASRGSVFYGLEIVVSGAGDAVIGWDGKARGAHVVQAAYRSRSGAWGPAASLSDRRGDAAGLAVAVADDGTATAVWLFGRRAGTASRVQARAYEVL